jgi:hypothetical protein
MLNSKRGSAMRIEAHAIFAHPRPAQPIQANEVVEDERARRCAFVDQRFAEGLREVRRDRPQAFAPMRQRKCEFVCDRRRDPANAVRELAKVARGKLAAAFRAG